MYFYYNLFGLVVRSEIESTFLPKTQVKKHDVDITVSKLPPKHESKRFYSCIEEEKFLLNVPGAARFTISSLDRIEIETPKFYDQHKIWAYLLGSVFAFILLRRKLLVIHGNTILDHDNNAIIFAGPSGIGKSTLAASFQSAGYSILSDDLSAIKIDSNGTPWVIPSYPNVKLWQDAIDFFGIDDKKRAPVISNKNKFHLGLDGFHNTPVQLKAIYCLEENRYFKVSGMLGVPMLNSILKNSFRPIYIKQMRILNSYVNLVTKLSKKSKVYRLERPKNDHKNTATLAYIKGLEEIQEALREPVKSFV